MFKSRLRPIVIPQSEHGRLAGTLALLWGNSKFDQPNINPLSLIAGIGLHDQAHGFLDTNAIGETPEGDFLQLATRAFYMQSSDRAADLIIKFHWKRLVRSNASADSKALLAEMEVAMQHYSQENNLSIEEFARIDPITDFCDRVAFDFSFEQPADGMVMIYSKNGSSEQHPLRYSIAEGEVRVSPWPFSVGNYSNYLVGYTLKDYPSLLDPVIIPYRISEAGPES